MYYDSKDMLRASVIPVLLGDSAAAHLMAAKIYLRSGIISYICDSRRSFWNYVDPFSRFFSLISSSEEGIVCEALGYLASAKDYLPIIVPCDEYFRELVENHREFLEKRFIISAPASFFTQKPMSAF